MQKFLKTKAKENYSKQELAFKEMEFDDTILERKEYVFRKACVLNKIEKMERPKLDEVVATTQNQLKIIREIKTIEETENKKTSHLEKEINTNIDVIISSLDKELNKMEKFVCTLKKKCKQLSYQITKEKVVETCLIAQKEIETIESKVCVTDNEMDKMTMKIEWTKKSKWKNIKLIQEE
ncbi:hypothetical protein EIN_041830 [Entamoeba invadens IP1]|uniref:Uncharacterized protein n=1 Tax=Entamoeba invadens IP1 TaxID=370355 RepID=L7FQK7_ENTIV|nr:hypothetical protein EIN_041830 [Entamoeba invadens IP1]ELP94564.1 hypothetical protein EIN_041830 [Entamoeba invadens IP1]|eukprot:XP_004261335.1 hypothetical protein EIN_041830 [Entamoeba invadens IP1]